VKKELPKELKNGAVNVVVAALAGGIGYFSNSPVMAILAATIPEMCKSIKGIVGNMQIKRVDRFLCALAVDSNTWAKQEINKFRRYVESAQGRELLEGYFDTVLHTSSLISNTALGLLYADFECEKYSAEFKRAACLSLNGMTDFLIEVFINLAVGNKEIRRINLFRVTAKTLVDIPQLCDFAQTVEHLGVAINNLVSRGIFTPPPAPNFMENEEVAYLYSKTEMSQKYLTLFFEAKRIIDYKKADVIG